LNQEPPVYTPPASIVVSTDIGTCTASLQHDNTNIFLQGTYTATCPLDSLYYTISGATTVTGPKTGSVNLLGSYTFNKGVSIVTYTAKTAGGLSASSSFSVTVNDGQIPVITCKAIDLYLDSEGHAVINRLDTLVATASDNCSDSAALTYQIVAGGHASASFTSADLGTPPRYVNIQATDEAGNLSGICAATVTVKNNQPPTAKCKPQDTLYLNGSATVTLAASRLAAASSAIGGQSLAFFISRSASTASVTTKGDTTFACGNAGMTHTVYVGVENTVNNKMAVCSTEVLVTDTVLHCTSKAIDTLYLSSGCSYTLTPAIDGDLIPWSVATPYRGCKDTLHPGGSLTLTNNKGFDVYQVPFESPKFPAGTHEIIWKLKDTFGVRATCTDVFAVVDTIRPSFSSVSFTSSTHSIASDSCTKSVTWTFPHVEDNCSVITYYDRLDSLGGTGSQTFTAGTYMIRYQARDASGNVSRDTVKILITVIDQNTPVIAAIADTAMQVDNAACCFATVPAGGLRPVISSVCTTGMTVTYVTGYAGTTTSPATTTAATGLGGVQFSVGATAVTYTVTAVNGNTATATFTVTVQDTVKPVITCKSSNQVRNYDNSGSYTVSETEFDVTATDNCGGTVTLAATIDGGTVTYSTLASHVLSGASSFTVTWTAADTSGNSAACSFTVTMKDTIPPVFTSFPDTIRVNTAATACAATVTKAQLAAVYTDNVTPVNSIVVTYKLNYKGAETSGSGLLKDTTFQHDTTVVTYTITDVAGKSRDSSFLVIVIDSVPPVFTTCPSNITGLQVLSPATACIMNTPATLTAPVFSDNCGGVETLSWSITNSRGGAVDTSGASPINILSGYRFAAGTNTVRYTAVDSSGNTAACSFTVEVADKVLPICKSVSTYTLNLQAGTATILDAKRLNNGSADNCGTLTYRLADASNGTFTCADIGTTRTVNLVVADEFGNESACAVTHVSVADTIAPGVTCRDTMVRLNASQGTVTLTAIDLASARDSCTAAGSLEYAILRADGIATTPDTTFGCADVGHTYTLTVRVLDAYGNAGTCTAAVTVRDTLLNHRGKITVPADSGACAATLSDTLNPEIMSGCTAATLTNSAGTNTYADMTLPVGTNTVTWTLNDGQGSVTVTDTIIVADTQKPILRRDTLANITYGVTNSCTTTAPSWNEPGEYIAFETPGTLATDNCTSPGSLTWSRVDTIQSWGNSSGVVPVGRWKIQYIAKDAAGNESDTLSFFVTVNENSEPVITCPGIAGKDTVYVTLGCAATLSSTHIPAVTVPCVGTDSLSHAYTFNGAAAVTEGAGSLADSILQAGLYSITYTVTNRFAETHTEATCAYTLAVIDTIKPTFTCRGDTTVTPASGTYTVSGTELDLSGISDNCGIDSVLALARGSCSSEQGGDACSGKGVVLVRAGGASISDASLAGMQFPAGDTYTIRWNVLDVHGNVDSCVFTLTVQDVVKPEFEINTAPTVYLDADGNGTLLKDSVIIYMRDNVTDSSAIVTTLTPTTFTCTDIGTVPGTFTATDDANNDTTVVITITVRDTVAPTFTLQHSGSVTVRLDIATSQGVLRDSMVFATLRDNCADSADIKIMFEKDTVFTCSDVGTHTVIFSVTDTAGTKGLPHVNNVRRGSIIVTVVDTLKPQFTCATNTLTKYTGTTSNSYKVTAGDTLTPALLGRGCGSYTFSHNYGGGGAELTDTLLPAGRHTITWTVANLSGLTATCDVTVNVRDTVKPTISCPPSVSEIGVSFACSATVPGGLSPATWSDNCAVDSVTWSIWCMGALRDSSDGSAAINGIPSTYAFSAGTNVITYTVVDTSGNRNTCSFTVPVKTTDYPICRSVSTYTLKLQGSSVTVLDPKVIDNGSSDGCNSGELSFDFYAGTSNFTCSDIGTPRAVRLRVTNASGRSNSCATTTITVIDTIAPVVQGGSTTLTVGAGGSVTLNASALFGEDDSDNCTPASALTFTFRQITGTDTTYVDDTIFTCGDMSAPATVTLAVKDAYGNIGTGMYTVTVQDTLKPVVKNRGTITVSADTANCYATLPDSLNPVITPGSSCSTVSDTTLTRGTYTASAGSATYAGLHLPPGTHELVWTVTASNATTTTVTDTIIVKDKVAPIVKNQMKDLVFSSSSGCFSETEISWAEPKSYSGTMTLVEDNCTDASALTWTRVDTLTRVTQEATAPVGKWKVQYVAKDEAGNVSDTVGFVLTVKATGTPSFETCPSGTIALDIDSAGVCVATLPGTFTPAVTGLGCSGLDSLAYKITGTGTGGSTFTEEGEGSLAGYQLPVGTYSATYTAYNRTDLTIPAATCTFNITVSDTVPPVITCVADTTLYIDAAGATITIAAKGLVTQAKDCTPAASLTYTFDAAGSRQDTTYTKSAAGQTYVHTVYVLDEAGLRSSCTLSAYVCDTLPPVFTLQGTVTVYLDAAGSGTLPMDSVIIHMGDNVTDSSKIITTLSQSSFTCTDIALSPVTVTFTATDSLGNSDSAFVAVQVRDTLKPVVTCKDTTVALDAAGSVTVTAQSLVTATAQGCTQQGALTYSFSSSTFEETTTFGCGTLGARTFTVYVTDATKEASCSVTVTVTDTIPPTITNCGTFASIEITSASCDTAITGTAWDIQFAENTGCTTVTNTRNNSYTLSGATFSIGVHPVTWTVTDAAGGSATCAATYTVTDRHTPDIITCMIDTLLVIDAGGSASITAQALVTATDCSPMSYTFATGKEDTTFSCGGIGTHTLAVTVTDSSGNESSCNAQVRVADTVLLVTCKQVADTVYINADGDGITLRADSLVTVTANCKDTLTYSFSSSTFEETTTFGCETLGPHTVTVYVTNATAKQASCSMTVTVLDTLPPVIKLGTSAIVVPTSPVTFTLEEVRAETAATITDNCTIETALTVTLKDASSGSATFSCTNNIGWIYAQDASGNKDSVAFSVTFSDTPPSTVTAHDTTLHLDVTGKATLTAYEVLKFVSDDCITDLSMFKNPANGLLTLNRGTFTCADVGALTVTISAQGAGHSAGTATFKVTVKDTLPPVITCADSITVKADAVTCGYTVPGTKFDPVAEDNCGTVSVLHDYHGGGATLADTLLPVGVHTITWTAADGSSNTVTCTTVITVNDSIPPAITCKTGYIAYLNAAGSVTVKADTLVTIVRECAPHNALTYSFSNPALKTDTTFACGAIGAQTLTVFVTDTSRNTSFCTVTVTVKDILPPVPTCVDTTLYINAAGTDIAIAAKDLVAEVFDCTPVGSLTYTFDAAGTQSGTTYIRTDAGGTYWPVVYVRDESDNSSTCSATVTVSDTLPPTFTLRNATVYLDANSGGTLTPYSVMVLLHDNVTDSSSIVITLTPSTTFTCAAIGTPQTVTFTAKDAFNNDSSATITVTVRDTIRPVVTCMQDAMVELDASGSVTVTAQSLVTATARGCAFTGGGALTYSFTNPGTEASKTYACNTTGAHALTVYVTDRYNNMSSCATTVTVRDALPPVITLGTSAIVVQASPVTFTLEEVLAETAATITDNCNAALTVTLKDATAGSLTFSCASSTGWIYAEDASGNKDSAVFSVTFATIPSATVTARDATVYLDAGGSATLTAYDVVQTVSDGFCVPAADLRNPDLGLLTLDKGTFTCTDVGTLTVTISAQGAGHSAGTATFTVTVKDTVPPTITCAADTSVLGDEVSCGYKVRGTEIYPTATDKCNITVEHNYHGGGTTLADTLLPVGIHVITWTVTDASGNTATCDVTVTVNDDLPPEITCKTDYIASLDSVGNAAVDAKDLVDVTKECAPLTTLTYSFEAYGASIHTYGCNDTAGVRSELIRVTDLSGNSSTCTVQFTVRDTLPPVVEVQNVTLRLDTSGAATLTREMVLRALRDNCTDSSDITVVLEPTVFNMRNMGATTVTVTATDLWGKKTVKQVQVTVEDVKRETAIDKRIQGRDVANKGDTVTFIITVTNKLGSDHNLIIVDSLPAGLSLLEDKVPGNTSVNLAKKVVTINHGSLGEGATVSYAIAARVEQEGMWTNYARLYRAEKPVDRAEATLNAELPELSLTAKIREGDYTNTEPSPAIYNVPDDYRLVVTLENEGGATIDRVDTRITYDPFVHQFFGSSRGAEVTDNGSGTITWTVHNFDGKRKVDLELMFKPLIAATYTFWNTITTQLSYEKNHSNNAATVTVNQVIIKVPNVVTSQNPDLHIQDLVELKEYIEYATMRVVNIWGNQVYYVLPLKGDDISGETIWFNAGTLTRGTYYYELIIHYKDGSTHTIKDYVEVLK
jgi:uncharacterized repeat protein (TIGR01451 family)